MPERQVMKNISKAKGTTGNANRQRGVAERTADQAPGGGVGVGVVQSSPSSTPALPLTRSGTLNSPP